VNGHGDVFFCLMTCNRGLQRAPMYWGRPVHEEESMEQKKHPHAHGPQQG